MKFYKIMVYGLLIFHFLMDAHPPRFLIKIPTKSRPEKFFHNLDLYYQKLSGKFPYLFLISCDYDDPTMNNYIIKKKLSSYPYLYVRFNENSSKIAAYNQNINEFIDRFDILIVTSDDMQPIADHFDEIVATKMLTYFPNFDGVLNFYDGSASPNINTYPILGINYYLAFGYVYYPEYKSFYCDNELVDISRHLNKEHYSSEILFRHCYSGDPFLDSLYKHNWQFEEKDKLLYFKRRANSYREIDTYAAN